MSPSVGLARGLTAAGLALAVQRGAAQGTFTGGGPAGTNVLNNTCNRIHHQSTVKDGNAWIDGGINTFVQFNNSQPVWDEPLYNTSIYGSNNYLIQIPLDASWDWKTNITEIAHDKGVSPTTNTPPPIVEHGALFQGITGDPRIWLFGGTTSYLNPNQQGFLPAQSNQYSLWSLDTTDNTWMQHDVSTTVPERPNNGYHADAPDRGLGFWLSGAVDNSSSLQTESLGPDDTLFQPGLLVFNFNGVNPTATNISTLSIGAPRVGGAMHYVPMFGEEGVLIAFGGRARDNSGSHAAPGTPIVMDVITVYDVAATNSTYPPSGFHSQTASGASVPMQREDFCVTGVPMPDNSGYLVLIYGGRLDSVDNFGHTNTTLYDEIWALSLPSFTWTKIFAGTSPRYGHTCGMANARQMITFGGANSTNLLNPCDWEVRGTALYDVPTNVWGSTYVSADSVGDFSIPQPVIQDIGGGPNGGATKNVPDKGFTNPELARIFTLPPRRHRSLSGGAIAGIVIGVVAAVVLLALLFYFFVFRKWWARRQQASAAARNESSSKAEEGEARTELDSSATSQSPSANAVASKVVETDGREVVAVEKDSNPVQAEMANTEMRYEMDAHDAEVRAEMEGDNLADKPARDVKKPLF